MRKTHSDKIREAVTDLGLSSPNEIMAWIKKHYPDDPVNPNSYRADIIGCSINHSSSHHYQSLPKFLWFEEGIKKYRLANPEEASIPFDEAMKTPPRYETVQKYIDGIPVEELSVTGQVRIPSSIRDKLGLQPGDILAFIINDQGILEVRKARIKLEFE